MPNTYFDTAKITGQVSALVPLIDDFEDQDFAEYVGDTGAASIVTSPVANGSYAAGMAAGENEIRSTAGLDNYPAQGDVFRWKTYVPVDGFPRFYWGVQDASNFYYLEYDQPNSTLRFAKVDAGTETVLATTNVTFDTGAYSETEVEWRTNGRHLIEYFDSTGTSQGTIDATDTTYTSGGVGWGEWSAAAVTSDLRQWYKLDEGAGSTAFDFADQYADSTAEDMTIDGATWTSTAKTGGQALSFDGTDDKAQYSNPDDLTTYTFCAWAYIQDLSKDTRIIQTDNSSDVATIYLLYDESLDDWSLGHYDGSNRDEVRYTDTSVSTGNWYHVAGTHDGSDLRIYIDGNFQKSASAVGNPGGQAILSLAFNAASFYSQVIIDDARVYTTAKSDSEIQTIYNNTV